MATINTDPTMLKEGDLTSLSIPMSAYPNPFNPKTTIRFDLPEAARANLAVYNAQGQLTRQLLRDAFLEPRSREIEWDGRGTSGNPLPSGVYFCKLETEHFRKNLKIALLK